MNADELLHTLAQELSLLPPGATKTVTLNAETWARLEAAIHNAAEIRSLETRASYTFAGSLVFQVANQPAPFQVFTDEHDLNQHLARHMAERPA